jgi:hypothetical protein
MTLPASELHLFATDREVLLHFDDEIGNCQTSLVTDVKPSI